MNEELDLLDLCYFFWKKKIWLILAVLVGILVGLVYTEFIITPKYTSSVTLILSKPSSEVTGGALDSTGAITQSDIALNQKLISTYGEIMKSRRVSNQVIENLDLEMTYDEIIKCIKVSSVKDTDVIKLSITTKDPQLSAKIADEMTKVFTEEIAKIYSIKNISIIDSAEVNEEPINISYKKNVVIFALVFLFAVSAIFFLLYYFDNTIKTEEGVQKITDLPVLASIPNVSEVKGGKKHA